MPQMEGSFIMRLRVWASLAIVVFISGCAGDPARAPSPEPAILTATPDPGVDYVAIIGDSYTAGLPYGANDPNGWPAIVTAMLKNQGMQLKLAVGATNESGYGDHRRPGSVTFLDQVRRVVGSHDKLVILFGAANDKNALPVWADKLAMKVQQTLATARARAPKAKLLVIGPAWVLPDPPPALLQARDIVRAQAEAIGATFVDPLAEGWFIDHPEMIAASNDRPDAAAHTLMAEKVAPLIAQQLQEAPAP